MAIVENKPNAPADSNDAARAPVDGATLSSDPESNTLGRSAKKRRSRWRTVGVTLLILAVLLACVRPMLPWAVRSYVNRTLDRNLLYEGRVGQIDLHLWRGAYTISDIRLIKKTGNVPTPFFQAKRLDFAIQWSSVLHRKVVGQLIMDQPQLNFVDASDDSQSQTGAGGPWLQTLENLFPFSFNGVYIRDGSIHFRSYQKQSPVDVYLSHLNASVDDLTNIRDVTTPLVTTVKATALAMDEAKFDFQMKLNPFSYRPTFQMATRLIGLDVTKINDLALSYGQFDFKRGWFDLVIEVDANEGQMQGYVKPLFRNLKVFDLREDIKSDDPLQFFWQAVVGITTGVLTNTQRDQFGTSVPIDGDLSQPNTDILSAIGNVLRNAFVRAYLPRFENGTQNSNGMQFGPGSITGPTSVGDPP